MDREFKERVEIVLKRLDNQSQMELCRLSADLLRQAMAELTTRVEPGGSPADFEGVMSTALALLGFAQRDMASKWGRLDSIVWRLRSRYHDAEERTVTPYVLAEIKEALALEEALTDDTCIVAPVARFLGINLDDPDVFDGV